MRIFTFSPFGYEGALVEVEVDLRRGIPAVDIVGLADGAVKECRERVRCAFKNSQIEFPCERVLISLSPADLRKDGAGFDLAIALAILNAQDETMKNTDCSLMVMGELELNGSIRPVRGISAAVTTALSNGIDYFVCNSANKTEVKNCKVIECNSLSDYTKVKALDFENTEVTEHSFGVEFPEVDEDFDFKKLKGLSKGIRALEVAIAGKHNTLFYGAPGCGKTPLMVSARYLTPLLTEDESHLVTRVHSLAGLTSPNKPFIKNPPFRMPHQTASIEGIYGGGVNCRPGEISLAHNGILFLDEAAEFRTSVLQMLRVPLESGAITLSRAGRSTVYPADFQLFLTTNPCPCGNYGAEDKICLCSARSLEMYWKKFSAPLLDRVAIRMEITRDDSEIPSFESVREHIKNAFSIQRARGFYNQKATPDKLVELQKLVTKDAESLLVQTAEINGYSPRRIANIQKLARTIADMERRELVEVNDMREAIKLCGDIPVSLR